eukprot:6265807-Prymnesium_polylepis.1
MSKLNWSNTYSTMSATTVWSRSLPNMCCMPSTSPNPGSHVVPIGSDLRADRPRDTPVLSLLTRRGIPAPLWNTQTSVFSMNFTVFSKSVRLNTQPRRPTRGLKLDACAAVARGGSSEL